MKPNLLSSLRRLTLLSLTATVLIPFASAQEVTPPPPASEEEIKLEAFTVTGTNLRRLEGERALPITRLNLDDIEVIDASQAADLVMALPQVTGLPGNETGTLGASARGDNSSVAMRGLPSSNTLILLNGRRLMPHAISQAEASVPTLSVNINQLPNRGIERIDVLRDGASSIYGTDAVAGVINYVTQREFKGTEISARYAETEIGDGQELRFTLTHGLNFAGDRGRGIFVFDVYDRDPIFARHRPFAADADNSGRAPPPWDVSTSTSFNKRSATSEYGNFLRGTINASGNFVAARGNMPAALVATSGRFFLVPTETGGVGFRTTTPPRSGVTNDYYYNNNLTRVLQPRSTRVTSFLGGEFDLRENLTAFVDLNYYRARSRTFREQGQITQSTDGMFVVPTTNPWNPFGERFWHPTGAPNTDGTPRLTGTPGAVVVSNKRFTDMPERVAQIDNLSLRGVAGLKGGWGDTWRWESALMAGENTVEDSEAGIIRESRLRAALNETDPARAFNPFTRTFAVQGNTLVVTGDHQTPQGLQDFLLDDFIRRGTTGLRSFDFRADGDVWSLWGGNTISMAVGGEYRYESFHDFRPPFAGLNPANSGLDDILLDSTGRPRSADGQWNDFLNFSPNSNTRGNRHVRAVYLEANLPLVGGNFRLPLVESLELAAAVRHESFTDFGTATKPKAGITWRPASWVLVRASYNEGFKAPNLAQLFTGTLVRTITGSTDTYRSAVTGLPQDGPSNRRRVSSGNLDLKPEESEGKSAGIVVDVPGVKGLSLGFDYWEIRQRGVITLPGEIPDDTASLLAATAAALAAGQSINNIDLGSGTAAYQGNPAIVRRPVTQADRDFFAAYNATRAPGNQRAVVGEIEEIRATYFNRALQFVNGYDFDATYRLPPLALGNITVSTNWSYLIDYHAYATTDAPRTELRWSNTAQVGGSTPKWRGTASTTWRKGRWSAGLSAFYIGTYTDVGATTTATTYENLGQPAWIAPVATNGTVVYRHLVRDSMRYNAYMSYRVRDKSLGWLDGTRIRLGVINLMDKEPPLAADSRGYTTNLYGVMARGRSWSLEITKQL